ncbi:mannitol dehydrogenase family protein [Arthrobacter sp. ISL-48]|uniref:mannitol dehydrogenase family protein n=1 Tax=Arthrobacter sp. ISL-48 TaxID=2819110 RepID=UPI001BE861A0|nr:mannitol dehydrogenase family protein [Arthrobacter sp. ISL-48]MBT2531157.1 mannitol dehydrogenase family protein [Arthrobacter sp. ISL-48]
MTGGQLPRLDRTFWPLPQAPVRIVHLGLGAFHRSHQAWYTQHAPDAADWGIAAFTGRRPDAALALAAQDGLFTIIDRSGNGDDFEVIGSIVEAVDGADVGRLCELVSAPETAVVTLTITEAAYGLASDGSFDAGSSAVAGDLAVLAGGTGTAGNAGPAVTPTTPLGRLVLALAARRDAGAGPVAVVSCDNLSGNGEVARRAIVGLAEAWDMDVAAWIAENVSFVSSSVDRITPRTTDADVAEVEERCGYRDGSPVVAEPFRDWVLSGDFPAGRPRWEDAGAVVVDDIEPYENRKLWLLNGAHSLLAYAGQLRGHTTVAEALEDPLCREAVEAFWDEASAHLPEEDLHIPEYREALRARFGNRRIAHHLSQIAADGTTKLRMRALPVLVAERSEGRSGAGSALMLAAWIDYVGQEDSVQDPLSSAIRTANGSAGHERVATLLNLVSPQLSDDPEIVSLVASRCGTLTTDTSEGADATDSGGSTSATSAPHLIPGRNS